MVATFGSTSLHAAATQLRDRYIAARPLCAAAFQAATDSMPGGGTRSSIFIDPFPLFLKKAKGSVLEDLDGHLLVDMQGDFSAGIYGHSNPVIMEAIRDALDTGIQLGTHTTHESRLANLITSRFPSIDLVRFANSGTEASMLAIATAMRYTGRRKVVVFEGGYHGSLLSGFRGKEVVDGARESESNVLSIPYDLIVCPYNDISTTRALLSNESDIACITVEPMLGAGGCIPGDPEFLKGLRELATEKGVVLVFDEVQTSRLSEGGRQKLLDIMPDLTTLGKYMGGGFAFGAFGGKREIMEMFDSRKPGSISHGGTYNNSILTMVAGATGLELVLTPEALDRLNTRGTELMDEINAVFEETGAPFYLTGLGSIMQFHVGGGLAGADKTAALDAMFFALLERGYHIAQRGLVTLSLSLGEGELEGFVQAVRGVVGDYFGVVGVSAMG